MKIIFSKHTLLIASVFIFLLNGCVKNDDFEFDNMAAGQWSPEFAVPLIHSGISIHDIIGVGGNSLFNVNSDHSLSLTYKTNIYSVHGYEFFEPVNQTSNLSIQMPPVDSATLYQTGTVSRSVSPVIPLTFPNGEQIDSLTFRKGELRINITNNIPHPGILNITIPSATSGGQPFSKDVPFTAATAFTAFALDISDMAGYNMKTNSGGVPNSLDITYTLTFTNSGSTSNTSNKSFDITTSFDSIAPASLFGYFGQTEFLNPSDSSEISLFNNFQGGSVAFDDPKMTITLSNSFGMPIDAVIGPLNAIMSDGSTVAVTGPIPSPLIDYPLALGQTVTNSFFFDKTNSNIGQILNSAPKFFNYGFTAGTNSPLPTYNFMSDSSELRADLQIEFPLKGYATGFTIQDTVDFGIGTIDEVTSADFRLNVSNGFPVNAYTQLYFTDDNYVVLDSLFINSQNHVIEAAEIDANGIVTVPTDRTVDELFDGVRLQHLYDAKKILIKGVIQTSDAPNTMVQIFDYYRLDFKLGVKTKLRIDY